MSHQSDKIKCLRYVYMLDVDNRGQKSKYYGHRRIFYPGIAVNLIVRLKQHIHHINSKFLSNNFPDSRKKLVFVKQLWGDEYDARLIESKVKRLSRQKKLELINSEENELIMYKPFKVIVLKKYEVEGEQVDLVY